MLFSARYFLLNPLLPTPYSLLHTILALHFAPQPGRVRFCQTSILYKVLSAFPPD